MSRRDRFDAWCEDLEAADAAGTPTPPTHRASVTLTIDVDLLLPPWADPDDALDLVISGVIDAVTRRPGQLAISEAWDPDTEIMERGTSTEGAFGTIEGVAR